MRKIMIIDDDFLVRSNIKVLLNAPGKNLAESFLVVAEASDGQEAIPLIEATKPDIVISDIRMPHMDGLELQEYLNEKYPQIKMIMLSGYDDFDYVRRALKNGAVDYMLKHKLNRDSLMDAMSLALNQTESKTESEYHGNIFALKRDFTMKLITGCYMHAEEITNRAKSLGLSLGTKNVMAVLMCVQNPNANTTEAYLQEYSVLNIVDEILQNICKGICCHISDEKYVLLLTFDNIYSKNRQNEKYAALCNRISVCLKKYLNINASFYQGQTVSSIQQARMSYNTAEDVYRSRYTAGINSSQERKNAKAFDILAIFDANQEKALLAGVRENSPKQVKAVIHDVFDLLLKCDPAEAEAQFVFMDVLSALNRAWKEHNIDITRLNELTDIRKQLHSFNSIHEAELWFSQLIETAFAAKHTFSVYPNSVYVSQAISYIHRHYSDDISQSTVAEAIGISPSYLSKQFKEDLGIGFADYLCNYRIEKAMSMLKESNVSNKDIAQMCGFSDDAYFSRVFKRTTGMTPKEYRKKKE